MKREPSPLRDSWLVFGGITLGLAFSLLTVLACKPSRSPGAFNQGQSNRGAVVDPQTVRISLENLPTGESRSTKLKLGIQGQNISEYRYKIGAAAIIECELAADYTQRPFEDYLEIDIGELPDGELRLCAVGMHESGIWQPYESATVGSWIKKPSDLDGPSNLLAIPSDERISLFWDDSEEDLEYLVVRSLLPISWQPEESLDYELGRIGDGLDLIQIGDKVGLVDDGLENRRSYHYAVFGFDADRYYSSPSGVSAIPSSEPYAWVALEPGAYLSKAVVGGTRSDGSRSLYLCRFEHINGNGDSEGYQPGKFVPAEPDDLRAGTCFYPFGNENASIGVTAGFELLVVTRGDFADWFEWLSPPTPGDIPQASLRASEGAADPENYICRFVQDQALGYRVPGKTFNGAGGCLADTQEMSAELRTTGYQILSRKPL